MKDRKPQIRNLEAAITKTQAAIADQKAIITRLETKLESQRWELCYQKMLGKFDEIDVLRQQVSDIIAMQNNERDN